MILGFEDKILDRDSNLEGSRQVIRKARGEDVESIVKNKTPEWNPVKQGHLENSQRIYGNG